MAANFLSQSKLHRRSHKRVFGFSDWEIDVANQLLQFSRNYEPMVATHKPNKDADGNEDHKPKNSPECTTDFYLKEDQDSYPKRLKQRLRPIQQIYLSTQPILEGVKAKKARLS